MSSIPRNHKNENEISDFVTKFMKEFQIGKLLFQCNAGKEGVNFSVSMEAIKPL